MHGKCGESAAYFTTDYVAIPAGVYLKRDLSVFFIHEEMGIRKQLVEENGTILCFPGISGEEALWKELGTDQIAPVVRFHARFGRSDSGTPMMVWQVRPDGRYWMDEDGFGGEDYESLSLYTCLDECGNFTGPFRLYRIGLRFFGEQRLMGDVF